MKERRGQRIFAFTRV